MFRYNRHPRTSAGLGLAAAVFAMLFGFSGEARAQALSLGEASAVIGCFYECKELNDRTWQEVTTLMIANFARGGNSAKLAYLNGNQDIIATSAVLMSFEDLDEVNICRSLEAAGIRPPSAGLVEILARDPILPPDGIPVPKAGVYAWMKNLTGRFFKNVDEPFKGRVTSVAKTECRMIPPNVLQFEELREKIEEAERSGVRQIQSILIEETGQDGPSPF